MSILDGRLARRVWVAAARRAALDAWRESARVRRCLAREQIQRKVTISWAHAPYA